MEQQDYVGRSDGLVDSAYGLDQVTRVRFKICEQRALNKGGPPLEFQLLWANHGPSQKSSHWLSDAVKNKMIYLMTYGAE